MKDEITLEQLIHATDTEPRLGGLRNLARSIFLDRNAQGMPSKDRPKIKAKARPDLRRAIRHARKSRDALLAGNIAVHECERDRARMCVAFARLRFFEPFVDQVASRYAKLDDVRSDAAAATAKKYARPGLDDLIRGCLKRGERTRLYAKEWQQAFGVSADTVERAICRIRKELTGK